MQNVQSGGARGLELKTAVLGYDMSDTNVNLSDVRVQHILWKDMYIRLCIIHRLFVLYIYIYIYSNTGMRKELYYLSQLEKCPFKKCVKNHPEANPVMR